MIERKQVAASARIWLGLLAAAAIGCLLAIYIFPSELIWPRSGSGFVLSGDEAQHAIAQRYFIRDDWHWPPLLTAKLATPDGALNIAFADGIPLLAIFLKLGAPVLPPGFHGIGVWYLIAYAMQPVAAVLALRAAGERRLVPALGVALLALSMPAFLASYGHAALNGHFLLLFGLATYFTLVADARRNATWFAALLLQVVAMLVHPYMAIMTLTLLAAVPATLLLRRDPAWRMAAYATAATLGVVFGILLAFGYLGAAGAGPGYGSYGMNLFSPVWPAMSTFLGAHVAGMVDATGYGGWEGYNWLGVGLLLGLGATVLLGPRSAVLALGRHAGLVLALIALTVLAVSHRVGLGSRIVLDLGVLPPFMDQFRTSGRFFWAVAYVLAIAAAIGLARALPGRWGGLAVLAMGLVQFADASVMRSWVRDRAAARPAWSVDADTLRALMAGQSSLTLLPTWFCIPEEGRDTQPAAHTQQARLLEILTLASESALAANTAYVARWRTSPRCEDQQTARAPVRAGELRVLLPSAARVYLSLVPRGEEICRPVGDLVACVDPSGPETPSRPPNLAVSGFAFALGEAGVAFLGTGFAMPERWGTWSQARTAVLDAWREGPTLAPLAIEFDVVGYAMHRGGESTVTVRVDGRAAGTWRLPDGSATTRQVEIPRLPAPGALRVSFSVAEPTRPSDRDGSPDTRRLGVALVAMRVRAR